MVDIPQLVFNGLVTGSLFALGSVGLTLVYGILRLVNFSHGDLLTLGGYVSLVLLGGALGVAAWQLGGLLVLALVALAGLGWAGTVRVHRADRWGLLAWAAMVAGVTWLFLTVPTANVAILASLVIGASFVALFAVVLDKLLWQHLRARRANLLTLMIVSIGVAFMLRSTLQMAFGGRLWTLFRQASGQALLVRGYLSYVGLGDVRITEIEVWILGTAVVAGLATGFVLSRTRTGKAMRALSDDVDLARIAGIDVERVINHVWVLGGALAALAGVLLAMKSSLHLELGWVLLLSLFASVILGGVGSVPGAVLGGYLIGLAQELSVPVLSAAGLSTSYKVAVGFLILILTLLVRPQGIMGVPQR